jgi:hypothetical protein
MGATSAANTSRTAAGVRSSWVGWKSCHTQQSVAVERPSTVAGEPRKVPRVM